MAGNSGTQERLAHAYLDVEIDVLWGVVHDDLPVLRQVVTEELKNC